LQWKDPYRIKQTINFSVDLPYRFKSKSVIGFSRCDMLAVRQTHRPNSEYILWTG